MKDKSARDGLYSSCKSCKAAYRETRKPQQKVINDKYRAEKSDEMKEARKSWRDNNKDHIKEYKAAWRKKKKEEENDMSKWFKGYLG